MNDSSLRELAPQDPDTMTTQQILDKASHVQDQSLQSLDRTLATIETTKQVGSETAQTLHAHTQQIAKVMEGVDEVESNIKQANRHLRAFIRRMATDKIIMVFMCLIVCLVVTIIVVKIVQGDDASSVIEDNVGT